MADTQSGAGHVEIAVGIVCAYVQNNSLPPSEIGGLIGSVHAAVAAAAAGPAIRAPEAPREPAVPVRKSVTPDHLVCLEDGRKLKSLKRHLRAKYDMSPEQYRAKWGLPADYPMVAPNYAAARSELAKKIGLGRPGSLASRTPEPEAGLKVAARSAGWGARGAVKRSARVA